MKSMRLNVMVMVFAISLSDYILAIAEVPMKLGTKVTVYNKTTNGGMPIKVRWISPSGKYLSDDPKSYPGADFIKAADFIPVDQSVDLVFDDGNFMYIEVIYWKNDKTAAREAIKFNPAAQGTELYVYGDNNVSPDKTSKDSSNNEFPARYVAWWTSNINPAATGYTDVATAQATINNMTGTKPVTIYAIDPTNTKNILSF